MDSNEKACERRERMRQNEMKNNTSGNLRDGFDRGSGGGNLQDISGDMGWKGMAILILVLVLGYVIYRFFFN